MKKTIWFVALLVCSFSIKAQDSSNAKASIEENSKMMQTAMESGDFEKFGSFFTEDVMFKMSGYEPLTGRAAVISAHKPMAEGGMKLVINTEEIIELGEFAHEIGNYEIHNPAGEKVDQGHYATLWKDVNGEWKIYRDVISTSVGAQ